MATIAIIPDKAPSKTIITPPPSTSSLKTSEKASEKPDESKVVSKDRKKILLLEARRARVSWVDASSCPFRNPFNNTRSSISGHGDSGQNELSLLQSTRACQSMKCALDVVKELYGSNNHRSLTNDQSDVDSSTYERIRHQVETQIATADISKILTSSIPGSETHGVTYQSNTGYNSNDIDNHEFHFTLQYSRFLQKLRSPECADFVQGMRNFVHSFVDMANDTVAINSLPEAIQNYLETLYSDFRVNPLWQNIQKNDNSHLDNILNIMIETFIYTKCYDILWSVLSSDEEIKKKDKNIHEKIAALQFITPKHLEVDYLITNTEEETNEGNLNNDWKELLAQPTQILQSVNHQFSPGKMLDCILSIYRGVNVVLKEAMQQKYKSNDKLPGADDLMPALILTVLNAKPEQIASNLNFIENFAAPEQLRGEAGYAFTNLYGAVQFISDLSLDENENSDGTSISSSFSISPEEFRSGLQQSRDAANKKLLESQTVYKNKKEQGIHDVKKSEGEQIFSSPAASNKVNISVSDIRAARLRGETINLDWAHRWRDNQLSKHGNGATKTVNDVNVHNNLSSSSTVEKEELTNIYSTPAPLPEGFTRSYKYLGSKPDDIRISDIPSLLREYQMLVKATESLLAERSARQSEEYKKQIQQTRRRLEHNAAEAALNISSRSPKK